MSPKTGTIIYTYHNNVALLSSVQRTTAINLRKLKRELEKLRTSALNPLNAELNPICHLLVLLGDLTFMGPCIVIIFQYTRIYNKMQRYTVYLNLETALHVSGGTSTYHQEDIRLYLQYLVFVTPLLLSSTIAADSSPWAP
jgi:hypothetical protein